MKNNIRSIIFCTILYFANNAIGFTQILSIDDFEKKYSEMPSAQLVDVRTSGEYGGGHLPKAQNIDYKSADFITKMQTLDKTKPVFLYCLSGGRSGEAMIILKQNGLSVVTGSDDNLANMLKAKRFDYFPRPIIAIWNEQKNQNEYKDLTIDETFILHYPTAFYFFVAPNQQKLADLITKGLERSIADGSFELVFNKYFKTLIQRTNIKNRLIFELENPLIKSTSLPLNRHSLWYKP